MAPRWLVRLLEHVLPEDRHDDLIGDLQELHSRHLARRGRFLAHVFTLGEGLRLFFHFTAGRVAVVVLRGARGISRVEFRLALRLLRKQPVMTLTSVVGLGVGIGIVAGGFSVFHQGLYGELPWSNGDQWITVESYDAANRRRAPMVLEHLRLLRSAVQALDYVGGAESGDLNVVWANGEVERVPGARVTPGTFRHLPYRPLLGRLLVGSDGAPRSEPVALVRESLWTRRFSRSPDVVGRSLRVAGSEHVVVGVLPDDAGYPSDGEIWLPMDEATLGAVDDRSEVGGRLVGLLAEGATPDQAQRQAQQLADGLSSPGRGVEPLHLRVTRLNETMESAQVQVTIALSMGVLLSVLLVIAANVANLVVARTSRRSPELAVRTALGASRSRIVGQLFVEMLVIGALASLLGLIMAGGILEVSDGILDELPFWVDLSLRPSTAAAVVLLSLLATAVTGVLPALRATGGAPADALRVAGRGSSLRVGWLGGIMIGAQVALSVALLGSAALFAQGFERYVDPDFDLPDERVLTARLTLDLEEKDLVQGGATTVADSLAIVLDALQRSVGGMPEVIAVGLASHLPRSSPWPEPLEIEGRAEVVATPTAFVGPGIFQVLQAEPLLGRAIAEEDLTRGAPPVAVVNQAFAMERFGTIRVLGRRIRPAAHAGPGGAAEDESAPEGPGPWHEIVGVVPDIMEVAGTERAAGAYFPLAPRRFVSLALRVHEAPVALSGRVRRAAYDVDPGLNVSEIVRLDQVGAENRRALGMMSSALTVVGVVTLLLSLAGVYAIVSLSVTRRTREIGVRVALGAEPRRILWSILRRSVVLVLGGAILGALAGQWLVGLRLFVFAVPDDGWWLFPGLVALMALAGITACWSPARRALSIEPVEALRQDQ